MVPSAPSTVSSTADPACAAAAAAVNKGLMPVGEPVTVRLDGGELIITVSADGNVTMRGPAVSVFDGEVNEC